MHPLTHFRKFIIFNDKESPMNKKEKTAPLFHIPSILLTTLILFSFSLPVYAGGEQEGAASATHGKYLAGQAIIVPPGDIRETGYIAQIDYNYNLPDQGPFAVYLHHGNRQISNKGQEEIIHIGIKANKTSFEALPPLNLAFVIDKSGSMQGNEKIDWVKDSFDIFIEKVRDIDYVSLIAFSSDSEVIFPSTRMDSREKRDRFKQAVAGMEPGGGTNLVSGLEDGYTQVLANFRGDYSNRVLFLTDGVGDSTGILDMAASYKEMGINVSTIGVGSDFDVNLMVDLAKAGGGSSRFISDRAEMKETFGDELDRMVVPAARDLKMTLELPEWVTVIDTWGYRNEKETHRISYSLPTLHNGDYETILAQVRINPVGLKGKQILGTFTVDYQTLDGSPGRLGPFELTAELTDEERPVVGYSNYTVLQSSTMLYIAQSMKEIGDIYYRTREKLNRVNNLRNELWYGAHSEEEIMAMSDAQDRFDAVTSEEIELLEADIAGSFQAALDRTVEARKVVLNNRQKLDNIGFDDELLILDKYVEILGTELELNDERIASLKENIELAPPVAERSVNEHIENLFNEIALAIDLTEEATMAVAPFLQQGGRTSGMTELLDLSALNTMTNHTAIRILDRNRLEDILIEQKLALSGLIDTENALKVGRLLSAAYMITGNVIPMTKSAMVFARIINVESGEVETVSQVIIPINDEVAALLKTHG